MLKTGTTQNCIVNGNRKYLNWNTHFSWPSWSTVIWWWWYRLRYNNTIISSLQVPTSGLFQPIAFSTSRIRLIQYWLTVFVFRIAFIEIKVIHNYNFILLLIQYKFRCILRAPTICDTLLIFFQDKCKPKIIQGH